MRGMRVWHMTMRKHAMHSFQGHYNSLQWKLVSIGRYRDLPEIQRTFNLIVHPPHSAFDSPQESDG